jgi:hypothetical protein
MYLSVTTGSSSNRQSYHQSLGDGAFDSEALKDFAINALHLLNDRDTDDLTFSLDGLVRVDLFYFKGRLVVNEIEGMEAVTFSSKIDKDYAVQQQIEKYWEGKIYESIYILFN